MTRLNIRHNGQAKLFQHHLHPSPHLYHRRHHRFTDIHKPPFWHSPPPFILLTLVFFVLARLQFHGKIWDKFRLLKFGQNKTKPKHQNKQACARGSQRTTQSSLYRMKSLLNCVQAKKLEQLFYSKISVIPLEALFWNHHPWTLIPNGFSLFCESRARKWIHISLTQNRFPQNQWSS